MRLHWALLLGAVVGAHAQGVVKRQNGSSDVNTDRTTSAPSEETTTSAGEDTSSTDASNSSSSSSSSSSEEEQDTTVHTTVTVTDDNVDTVSRVTTVFTTTTTTVVNTITEVETKTITENDPTSTSTVLETTTQWVEKRDLSPRTVDVANVAIATAAPYTTIPADWPVARPAQDAHGLAKRATVTEATTVTVDGKGDATTVFSTAHRTVVTTVESSTTTTSTFTKTAQSNAQETVTTTSTVTVTSTSVSTGVKTTEDPQSTGGSDSDQGNGNSDKSSGGGGLSTGAKAGIGAGVGVAGLAVIAGLIWFCLRRRRDPKPDHDDLIGASEVPVGGPGPVGSGHTPATTAHHGAAAAFPAPGRSSTKPSYSPEGYRGTALGDGRAGFAKPAPYGAAYAGATSPTTGHSQPTDYSHGHTDRSSTLVSNSPDGLPEHPTPQPEVAELSPVSQDANAARWHEAGAAEIDSRPAVSHQSGPVYEMPGQSYR